MPDLNSLSNEELMAIAGVSPPSISAPASSDLSSMSNEDLMKIAGVSEPETIQQKAAGVLGSVGQGVTFGLADEAAAGVRAGISGAQRFLGFQPSYQDYESELEALRGGQKQFAENHPVLDVVGQVAGGLAVPAGGLFKGATAAQRIGNAAKAGGGLSALYGFGQGEGGFEQRAQDAATSGAIGFFTGGALGTAGEAASFAGRKMTKAGKALDRKSIGASYGDYLKSSDDLQRLDLPEGETGTRVRASLDDLLSRNELGPSRDPLKLAGIAKKKQKDLSSQIASAIGRAEEANPKVVASFPETFSLFEQGKIPAEEIDRYLTKLAAIEKKVAEEGAGSLAYLQQQKISRSAKWNPNDGTENLFNRAVYADLRNTVEGVAPEVAPLNEELSKWKDIQPIIKRGRAKAEGADLVSAAKGTIRTTGGVGVPMLIGYGAGGPIGAAIAGLLGYGVSTGSGQRLLGKGLQRTGAAAAKDLGAAQRLTRAIAALSPGADSSTALESQSKTQLGSPITKSPRGQSRKQSGQIEDPSRKGTKTVREPQELSVGFRSLAEALAPAVIKVESGGKNDAVSPKGAAGLMQLMPRTAKNLGVSDRFDPEQNVEGGIKLLAEELARFKSVPLALAAYNAGSPRVMKAIEKAGTTDPIQVMKHLPKETQNYLPAVMKALESMA